MSSILNDFTQRIKSERARQGLSYQKLADLSGCSDTNIWLCETKGKSPTIETADKLLKALGVSMTLGKENNNESDRM